MADSLTKPDSVSTSARHRDAVSPTPWRVIKAFEDEPARIIDADDDEVAVELIDADAALIVEAVNGMDATLKLKRTLLGWSMERDRMKLDLADERMRSDRLLQQLSNEVSDNARLRDELRQETEATNRYFEAASAVTAAYNDLRNIVRGLVAILDTITLEDHEIALLDEAREAVKEGKP